MNKQDLSERDIRSKFIRPTILRAGWNPMLQIREEVSFTNGRIIVRGKLVTRGRAKRADYILYYKPISRSPSSKPRTTATALAMESNRLLPHPEIGRPEMG